MSWGFINSGFAWGLFAIAIPIIIHLLFKRQHKKIAWAAIHFLKEAENRIRKQLRLLELLLLLLRTLIMVLLVFLFGKLFVDHSGVLRHMLKDKPLFYHIVLDDSGSMGLHTKTQTPFQASLDNIQEFFKKVCTDNEEAFVSFYCSSNLTRPILQKIPLTRDSYSVLQEEIRKIKTVAVPLKVDGVIALLRKQMDIYGSEFTHSVKIYSDFRDMDWKEFAGVGAKEKLKSLSMLTNDIYFIDCGNRQKFNLALSRVMSSEKKIVQNVPTQFMVEVRNDSEMTCHDVEVTMVPASGARITKKISSIQPNEKQIIPFAYTFKEIGNFEMSWVLGDDDLEVDNQKNIAIAVSEGVKILLVDGNLQRDKAKAETKFLQIALAPPGEISSGNRVDIQSEDDFEGMDISRYEIIYLNNLYQVPLAILQPLYEWVAQGGHLVITLGDQIDAEYYNKHLYANGDGLLPSQLEKIEILNQESVAHFTEINFQHPMFQSFSDELKKDLFGVNFYSWWKITPTLVKDSRVLAWFQYTEKQPAWVEKSIKKGKVLLFTSTISDEWSNWPSEFSYLIVQMDLVKYCIKGQLLAQSVVAGDDIKIALKASQYRNKMSFDDKELNTMVALTPISQDAEYLTYLFSHTVKTGFYYFECTTSLDHQETKIYAVNAMEGEGAPEKSMMQSFVKAEALPNIFYERINQSSIKILNDSKNELWKFIFGILLVFLLCESLVAWYWGKRR